MAKINFVNKGPIPLEAMLKQAEQNRGLGFLDMISGVSVASGPLAVVGGGPSAAEYVDELREWPGAVWAINGTWKWCRDNSIKAIFFSIDPTIMVMPYVRGMGIERAIIATHCHPDVVAELLKTASILAFDHNDAHGPITASAAPLTAAKVGHNSVTFFGCEGNFSNRSHVDRDSDHENRMLIKCDGRLWNTTAEFMIGLEALSLVIREIEKAVPGFIKVRGDGLLSAMIRDSEWDCIKVTRKMAATIEYHRQNMARQRKLRNE